MKKLMLFIVTMIMSVVANAQYVVSGQRYVNGQTIVELKDPYGNVQYRSLQGDWRLDGGIDFYTAYAKAQRGARIAAAKRNAQAAAEAYGYGSYYNGGGYYGSTGNIIVDAISTGIGIANTVKAVKAEKRARKAAEAARRPVATTRATATRSSSSRELHVKTNGDILFE